MTVPIAARDIAAAAGAILVLGAVVSVVGTVIVPPLLIWPVTVSVGVAFTSVGPALWTFGDPNAHGFFETAVLDSGAMAGLITVTLQIAYLPHLYAAFNRRESEIALLNSRAGMPSWGPELPSHEASWVTALLSVLDSAALYLALCPGGAPAVPTRLCLRGGMMCFGEVARSMGLAVPAEPDPGAGISLGYDAFLDAVSRLNEVGFPIEREPEAAWPHFVGWRVNYEQAAYAIAEAVGAVPALSSGPRRRPEEQIPPLRPGPGLSS